MMWPEIGMHANLAEIFIGAQETIIYWLVMRNQVMVLIFNFCFFWRENKMGVAIRRAPYGLGPPNPTKLWAYWVELLDQPLSWNHVFEISSGEPSP